MNIKKNPEQEIDVLLQSINQKIQHRVRLTKSELNNLTLLQVQALKFIHSNEQVTPTDLSRTFQVSKPSASALVERLVEHGWLKRMSSSHDRRTTLLTLSKKAMEKLDGICEKRSTIAKKILQSLTTQEKNTLSKILKKIHDTLK